jgi:hypothetical protein
MHANWRLEWLWACLVAMRPLACNLRNSRRSVAAPVAAFAALLRPTKWRNYMNLHKSIIAAVALTGFVVALPTLAQDDKTVIVEKTTTTKHHYVYYGDHHIYFAPETKTYYWQTNGTWTSGTALPPEDQVYIKTKGMEIDLDTDKPYTQDEIVIAKYKTHDKDGGG